MRLTRRQLKLIIENFLFEQEEEEEELPEEGKEEEDEEVPVDDEEEEVEDNSINLKLDIALDNAARAKLNIVNDEISVKIINAQGETIDLNQIAQRTPAKRKEITKDMMGVMKAAIDNVKDPVDLKKIRLAFTKMLGEEEDEEYIDKNRALAQYKTNVSDKYA